MSFSTSSIAISLVLHKLFSIPKVPDGLMYAIAGEVPVEIKTGDTPQETMSNMHDVIATALAPSDPSPQDLSIASKARVIMMKAQQEFTKEMHEQITNSNEYTKNAKRFRIVTGKQIGRAHV